MVFDKLPYDVLEYLFQWLKPRERMLCSEVCRSWYEVIATAPKLMRDVKLNITSYNAELLLSTLKNTVRCYRQLELFLETRKCIGKASECVTEILKQGEIEKVRLVGGPVPVELALELMPFNFLTELKLVFPSGVRTELASETITIVFAHLKVFHCTQYNKTNEAYITLLNLVVPELEEAVFNLRDESYDYDCEYYPLVELHESSKLKYLEIDFKGSYWDRFFALERPLLERFVIHGIRGGWECLNLNTVFTNMPNLRWLEILGPRFRTGGDTNHATQGDEIDISCLNTSSLERIHFQNITIRTEKTTLNWRKLTELTCKNVNVCQNGLDVFAPILRKLSLQGFQSYPFKLCAGRKLHCMVLEDTEVEWGWHLRGFVESLDELHELTLAIDRNALTTLHEFGLLRNLKSLKVVFHAFDTDSYECQALISFIYHNCPRIERVRVRNESEAHLHLSDEYYRQLLDLGLECLEIGDLDIPTSWKSPGVSRVLEVLQRRRMFF